VLKMDQGNKIGKIKDYDGFAGTIITEQQDYIFNKNDVEELNDENIQDGDLVTFAENTVTFGDEQIKVARFVKVLKKNKN